MNKDTIKNILSKLYLDSQKENSNIKEIIAKAFTIGVSIGSNEIKEKINNVLKNG